MNLGRDHRVELEPYSGPLDLLLWLIREEEVDIHDIPISRILERYLETLQTLTVLNLDDAGEFLVMASTLMEIKSRSLMPREEAFEDEEFDPRFELVQKLLEYKRFKEVSEELRRRADHWAQRHPPGMGPDVPEIPADEVPLAEVSILDLALAFQRVLAEVGGGRTRSIVFEDVPIEEDISSIMTTLTDRGRTPFRALFPPEAGRGRVTGLFLALLELLKRRRVRALQTEPFGPIVVEPREGEPEPAPAAPPPEPPPPPAAPARPPVPPLLFGAFRLEALPSGFARGFSQDEGYIVAFDAATGVELWTSRIYDQEYDEETAEEVPEARIVSLAAAGDRVAVTDERGRRFLLNPATRRVSPARD